MKEWIIGIICPAFGAVLANAMYSVPLPTVAEARRNVAMGALNPLPWVAAFVTTLGYSVYGILRQDLFVFLANAPGLALSIFYALSAVSVLSATGTQKDMKLARTVEGLFMFGVLFWIMLSMFCGWYYTSDDAREQSASTVGLFASVFCIAYYAAPLSTAIEVVSKRDATSLHGPMICVNFINSALWFIYGYFAIGQYQIWLPNAIGAALAAVQLLLIGIYASGRETSFLYEPIVDTEEGAVQTQATTVVPHFPPPSAPPARSK